MKVWISPGSTTEGSVVDPLCAACEDGFVPDELVFVRNPKVAGAMDGISETARDVVAAYSEPPDTTSEHIEDETDFAGYYEVIRDLVRDANDRGAETAVNITPGRKYMSGIAMQTGVQEADHVYYLLIESQRYYGREYHNIPSTATELYDFTEEIQ